MRIIACFASTLDGKIADKTHPRDRIGSQADLEHLLNVRNQADAILCGGETFREYPNLRRGSQTKQVPLQCLLTQSFNLPTEAPLFRDSLKTDPHSPILVFSPTPAPPDVQDRYATNIEWIATGPGSPVPVILETLEKRGVQTLLVEGGGYIMHMFLKAQAVQELYLTLCPLFLGGRDDPSLVTGTGFTVAEAPRTEVLDSRWTGQELYLHLRIAYPEASSAGA
ncbi:MAG TPA: RibD family protein [Coleofasciculaceae cyanobacterium]|jgi:5-amino-6-(5-phosphoribosylamino)uracil reductase